MNPQTISTLAAVAAGLVTVGRSVIRTWLTPTRLAHVSDIASMAVEAAEKLGVDLGASGPAKCDYAADVVSKGARRLGIKLNRDEALAFIHAALANMERESTDHGE